MTVLSEQVNPVQHLQSTQAFKSKEHPMERNSNFYSSKIMVKWVATSRQHVNMLCHAEV